jgi:hypothetical protein
VFAARHGPGIILLGSGTERPLARQVLRRLRQATVQKTQDMCGATALSDLPDLVQSFDCLLTPDTGLMHMAAEAGVPVLAFFLSSAWCFETGPYGSGHRIWQAMTACAPCVETKSCPHQVKCLVPFRSQDFLAQLAEECSPDRPEGLVEFSSGFDALGVCYNAQRGVDPYQAERGGRRAMLAEILATPGLGRPPHGAAQELLRESDWMLPGF